MGKTYIDEKGYKRFKDSDKLVHRWVGEKMMGRPLGENEVVHHKNGDRSDSSRGNLWVYPGSGGRSRHARDHSEEREQSRRKRKSSWW